VELSTVDGPGSLLGHMSGGDDLNMSLEGLGNIGDDGVASDVESMEEVLSVSGNVMGVQVLGLAEEFVQIHYNEKPLSLVDTFLSEVSINPFDSLRGFRVATNFLSGRVPLPVVGVPPGSAKSFISNFVEIVVNNHAGDMFTRIIQEFCVLFIGKNLLDKAFDGSLYPAFRFLDTMGDDFVDLIPARVSKSCLTPSFSISLSPPIIEISKKLVGLDPLLDVGLLRSFLGLGSVSLSLGSNPLPPLVLLLPLSSLSLSAFDLSFSLFLPDGSALPLSSSSSSSFSLSLFLFGQGSFATSSCPLLGKELGFSGGSKLLVVPANLGVDSAEHPSVVTNQLLADSIRFKTMFDTLLELLQDTNLSLPADFLVVADPVEEGVGMEVVAVEFHGSWASHNFAVFFAHSDLERFLVELDGVGLSGDLWLLGSRSRGRGELGLVALGSDGDSGLNFEVLLTVGAGTEGASSFLSGKRTGTLDDSGWSMYESSASFILLFGKIFWERDVDDALIGVDLSDCKC